MRSDLDLARRVEEVLALVSHIINVDTGRTFCGSTQDRPPGNYRACPECWEAYRRWAGH